jgi:hypothetical protein
MMEIKESYMTPPEEKAKDLIAKFGKQYALICVDEILATTYMNVNKYWQQVKREIIANS